MNINLIEEKVMRAVSGCIFYVYGNICYYVELLKDTKEFNIKVYDIKYAELSKLTDDEREKHLIDDILIDFGHIADNNLDIVNYIVKEIEETLYGNEVMSYGNT